MIDMDIIRALAFQGVPDMEGLRSIYWKVRSHCAQCTRAHMSARHASRRRDVRAWAWGSCVSHTHNACVRAAAPGLFAARQARVVPSPAAEQVHARTHAHRHITHTVIRRLLYHNQQWRTPLYPYA
jgi:hypothetical protein